MLGAEVIHVESTARPDGTRRYQSPLFAKKEQFPGEADPAGVLLSAAAVEVLPDAPTEPVPHRPGVMLLQKVTQASEKTTTRMGVAWADKPWIPPISIATFPDGVMIETSAMEQPFNPRGAVRQSPTATKPQTCRAGWNR